MSTGIPKDALGPSNELPNLSQMLQYWKPVAFGLVVGYGSTALAYPGFAALTLYRVAYRPRSSKIVQTSAQDIPSSNSRLATSPLDECSSWWRTLKSTYRKFGLRGLYKGCILAIAGSLSIWPMFGIGYAVRRLFPASATSPSSLDTASLLFEILQNAISALLVMPTEILSVRALTSSQSLPVGQPLQNLHHLTTEEERSHPLSNFFTPSRVAIFILPGLIRPLSSRALQYICANIFGADSETGLITYFVLQTLVECLTSAPLAVLADRLSLTSHSHGNDPSANASPEKQGAHASVVPLRPATYSGISDAVRGIVAEEGLSTLWRGFTFELAWNLLNLWMTPRDNEVKLAMGFRLLAARLGLVA